MAQLKPYGLLRRARLFPCDAGVSHSKTYSPVGSDGADEQAAVKRRISTARFARNYDRRVFMASLHSYESTAANDLFDRLRRLIRFLFH